jgi:hypothetical protein
MLSEDRSGECVLNTRLLDVFAYRHQDGGQPPERIELPAISGRDGRVVKEQCLLLALPMARRPNVYEPMLIVCKPSGGAIESFRREVQHAFAKPAPRKKRTKE